MKSAQFLGDLVDVVDDAIRRKMSSQMSGNVASEVPMLTAEEQGGVVPLSSVSVDRHHRVYVVEDRTQSFGGVGRDLDGRNVPFHSPWLVHAVVAGVAVLGGVLGDHFGHLFQSAAVVGHETQAQFPRSIVAPQNQNLVDLGVIQQLSEHVNDLPSRGG